MRLNMLLPYCFLAVFCQAHALVAHAAPQRLWKSGDPWPHPQRRLETVDVKARVVTERNGYSFYYSITNSTRNVLPIAGFEVDLRHNPENHSFSNSDLSTGHEFYEHKRLVEQAPRVHPVKSTPAGWDAERKFFGQTGDGAIWGVEDDPSPRAVQPGTSLDGFVVRSTAPPGIRDYAVDAYRPDLPATNAAEIDYFLKSSEFRLEEDLALQATGRTLAPVAPPDPFTISSWTARMLHDVREARTIGWIKADAQLTGLELLIGKLEARSRSGLASAVGELGRYVRQELASGRITPEADALIRLNAEYLLQRVEREPDILKRK